MDKVLIDPGHAPGNVNGGFGYLEYQGMWTLSNYLQAALRRCGIQADLTRTEKADPSLSARGRMAKGYDMFISEHSNAAANASAQGVTVFHSVRQAQNRALAARFSKELSTVIDTKDRGAAVNESTKNPGQDYYTVILEAVRAGCPRVFLIENGFHTNAADVAFLKTDAGLRELAEYQAYIICDELNKKYAGEEPELNESQVRAIVREEAAAIVKEVLTTYDDKSYERFKIDNQAYLNSVNKLAVHDWAREVWDKATAAGVFDGSMPRAALTREQAALVLDRLGLMG